MTKTINKVSAGGVIYHKGRVLTIKWLSKDSIEFPKGTIEAGETKEGAAIREVLEETGHKARILQSLDSVTFKYGSDDGKHYKKTVYYFLMKLINEDTPNPNREDGENFENLWLTPEQADALLTYDDGREILMRTMNAIGGTEKF